MKMSFNDKLSNFFENFSLQLGTAPSRNLIYLYADYVELVSLFSNQNYVSSSDILDRLKDEGIFKQRKSDQDQSKANDEDERLIDSVFRLLNERSLLFKDDYPFSMHGTEHIILKEDFEISDRSKIYIYLLISSCLDIFSDFQPELTTEFESLSTIALSNFLPTHAVVKSFGKNSDYKGTAVEKIKSLAKDMKVEIDDKPFSQISTKGTQEKGLDIVGWVPFSDTVANFLSIFVQCACGKDWHSKLGETNRYNRYFDFHVLNPTHAMFLPYNLVSFNKNDFYRNDEFGTDKLVFERKRILNYLINTDFFNHFESKLLVEECIKFQEAIV